MNFKASVEDSVELVVEVPSEFRNEMIPRGTRGTVVERYEHPREGYSIDLAIPDSSLVGGFRYENVVLIPEQFVVIHQ
ncbi:MAG TPA: hypothetical protein VF516_18210 [Kofleriaceae bacterium]